MERSLGLMAGAGVLPGRAAAEAKRRGWRVVAFAFEDAPGLAEAVDTFIPSTITDIQAVLAGLAAHRVEAAVFVGKFWKSSAFSKYDQADAAGQGLARGGLSDEALAQMVVATLAGMRIEVLDQREFLAPWLLPAGTLGGRAPVAAEWDEIREGFRLAGRLAADGVGQTVVRARGVTVALEAAEGTDEAIRRGGRSRRPRGGGGEGGGDLPRLPLRHPHRGRGHARGDARGRRHRARRPGGPGAAARPRRGGAARRPGGHRGGERR